MISGKGLFGRAIEAQDGHIGSLHDLYFDDQVWTVRYLVIDTAKWLPGRKVLISPEATLQPWHGEGALPVKLTKDQIKSSPDIDTAHPLSRKAERLLYTHYGWIPYWAAPGVPVPPPPPPAVATSTEERREAAEEAESAGEPRLCSTREVLGYHLLATDGEIGHVEDLVLDDNTSRILFVIVNLGEWLSRKTVLLSPRSISKIDWASSRVVTEASRQAIKASPAYKPPA
jgi:uncharacterized protein YrrD